MRSRRPERLVLVAVVAVLVGMPAACGDDDDGSSPATTARRPATSTTVTTAAGSTTTVAPAEQTAMAAYFLRGEVVGPLRRVGSPNTPGRAAIEALLAGPTGDERAAGLSTAVPDGTRLLGLDIADGTATVDLSGEFASGGGSLSMMARVAQVVFTLTQFPTVQRVAFSLDGTPATALGGEGLVIDQPQTRADWESMAPAILVESPLPGDQVTSPLVVSGSANTFEAMFWMSLTGPGGERLFDGPVKATSGTGTRGTFSQTIAFPASTSGAGVLEVHENSAKDGSPIHAVSIPVEL